jgi:hypothetical protein
MPLRKLEVYGFRGIGDLHNLIPLPPSIAVAASGLDTSPEGD